jgi:hypothetical protein
MLVIIAASSCKKFIEIPSPKTSITSAEVFRDSLAATSAVLGLYTHLTAVNTGVFMYGGITIATGLSADELISNTGSVDESAFYTNGLNSNISTIAQWWQTAYLTIYQANACIEGISASKGISASCKAQLTGECKFMRSLVYFNLVNIYGAVPLITTSDYRINQSVHRTPVDSVYTQIINDLADAQNTLHINYLTAGRVRPNQSVATALLAKVYLYRQDWAKAAVAAGQIINSATYALEPDLNNVFLSGSQEAIFQLIPVQAGAETVEGSTFVPADPTVIPSYTINSYLLNAFEPGDQRFSRWLNSSQVNGDTYYYPFKYQFGYDGLTPPKNYYILLRLAEQYLIRAEANTESGNLAEGVNDLNVIRNRAGLPNTTASTKDALLSAIYHERQIELFCELGNRWYDLKRTGLTKTVLPAITTAKGGTWSDSWQLYPVPFQELLTNPFLKQNTGY